jgi:hypothetical protein
MKLTWMPPRKVKRIDVDLLYPDLRHWLVNEDGRILAMIVEPAPDNPQDSFDAKLYYTMTDDTAYFISLDHAQAWCEKRAREDWAAEEEKKKVVPAAVSAVEVSK